MAAVGGFAGIMAITRYIDMHCQLIYDRMTILRNSHEVILFGALNAKAFTHGGDLTP